MNVRASSFRQAPSTYFVVLAWLRDERSFHETCWLIPSVRLFELAHDDGHGRISFVFRPDSRNRANAPYRVPLASLASRIGMELA